MDRFSTMYASNSDYVESLFEQFQSNPQSVPHEWRTFFESVKTGQDIIAKKSPSTGAHVEGSLQNRVSRMVNAYRNHGHKYAHLDPLGEKPEVGADLSLAAFNLSEADLDKVVDSDGLLPSGEGKLRDVVSALQTTYCNRIGVQYALTSAREERAWLKERMEKIHNLPSYAKDQKQRMFKGLVVASQFEKFLHTKFVGMKRFSVEGGEALIPMLDTMMDVAGSAGVSEVIMGMAHRGRLNVLANILDKPLAEIMAAFNEKLVMEDDFAMGDVKYHMGKSYDVKTRSGDKIHVSLHNNPSHLEQVNPVVCGSARAKQDKLGKDGKKQVMPVTIHGDSAFAGQGIVAETLNLANLEGYTNGGTVHIIINNQIGFTANKTETFSGQYCTDVARMLQVPIFHVNGDDVEACNFVMELATAYRNTFGKDVFVDLVCYRKFGHNEGDDPMFTNPVMYNAIKAHKSPYEIYREKLLAEDSLGEGDLKLIEKEYKTKLDKAYDQALKEGATIKPEMFGGDVWQEFQSKISKEPKTAIASGLTKEIAGTFTALPKGFKANSKIQKLLERRENMMLGKEDLDWGTAEMAAYGALLNEGYSVRLSGQDVRRGTFTHRHSYIFDQESGEAHVSMSPLAKDGSSFTAINSALSELAVMGFEFGYSLADPKTLTIWEAQFGDFANGAQMMIDQFVSSSETKWRRYSGLVLLLPHGFEGQGPEHSSARLERFLQLSAQNNWSVCNLSTPSQIFHVLRRQMLRTVRKPLVIMTPKSLLRHPLAVSPVSELTKGEFKRVIADEAVKAKNAKRLVLCSGKVYYDLIAEREKLGNKSVAIARVEELYPFAEKEITEQLKAYKGADVVWVQEEPKNQGAWWYMLENLAPLTGGKLGYIGREASSSPAVGSGKVHAAQQQAILDEVFKK